MTKKDKKFIESVYEIAFGDNAINRNFDHDEVIAKLTEFSVNAYKYEKQKTKRQQSIILKGKNIVVTGTISGMTRKQFAKKSKHWGVLFNLI